MNKPSFKLKQDWYLETDILGIKNKTLILPQGQTFDSNEDGTYHIMWGGWSENTPNIGGRMILTEEEMKLANDNGNILFEVIEPKKNVEIIIQEIPEDDDILVRNWRIQLDVKTTRKKLKDIEIIIKDKVLPIL